MDALLIISIILHLLLGYAFGSIPFGLILTNLAGLEDIRRIGSGNIGATNVLRTGSKKLAILTLFLDGIKGAIAIYVQLLILQSDPDFSWHGINKSLALVGLGAVLGHCYPVWLKFKGGKGVATTLGVLLAAVPYAGIAACAAWLVTAFVSKISSLSALVALAVAPVVTFIIYGAAPGAIATLISALVYWRHKDNIRRLLKREEPKISFNKSTSQNPLSPIDGGEGKGEGA